MAWRPPVLRTKHHEIIRLSFLGQSGRDIAAVVGVTPQTVYCILASPLAKAELSRLKAEAEESMTNVPLRVQLGKEMNEAAVEAIRLRRELMNDVTVNVRTRDSISKHFADRVIFEKETDDEKELSYRELLRGIRRIENAVAKPVVKMLEEKTVTAEYIEVEELGEHVTAA